MAKPKGVIPTADAWKQIQGAVRHIQRNQPARKARRQRRRRALGGGSCDCVTVWEIRAVGAPTGGTLIMDIAIDDGSTVTTENVTFDWNEAASGAQTALEGHSKIASTDITVKGGTMPNGSLYVVFLSSGTLNRDQPLPTTDTNSLTGGSSPHFQYSYMTNANWEA